MAYIHVLLMPAWDGEKIPELHVRIRTDIPAKAGGKWFSINRMTVIKPFIELSEPFSLSDAAGPIQLTEQESSVPPVTLGDFYPQRDSEGECELFYALKLAAADKNPVFDLGYEPGGMNGAGMTFMPSFNQEGEISHVLEWDLNALPPRAVGVWSYLDGEVVTGDKDTLQQTFYAAGMLDSVRLGNFSYYWFSNDKVAETAVETARIFGYESRFFQDAGEPYTIIARHAPWLDTPRAGGTALRRSYMYLYQNDEQLDPLWLKFLFAHEMVHNWVHLADDPFGTCTWYVEGMAEYYSALLPFRLGVASPEDVCHEINGRAKQYYENPQIHATNAECGAGLFLDAEKTRVPYGRGFFYLTHADAMIRQATNGEKCLDDVVLELNRRYDSDHTLKNEAWFEVYGQYVGEDTAWQEYEAFRDGGIVVPSVDCYEGRIVMTQTEGRVRGTNDPCVLYQFSPA